MCRHKPNSMVILLTPLDKSALEVGLRLDKSIEFKIIDKNLIDKQPIHKFVTLVEIYGSHHRLKSVTKNMFLRRASRGTGDDIFIKAYASSNAIKSLARHHLRAQLRQKTLVFIGELNEKIVRSDTLDNSITQKL